MKKTLKYILLGCLTVLLVAGGWIYYLFNIKTYDIEDAVVSEVTESDYVIDLPTLNGGASALVTNDTTAEDMGAADSDGAEPDNEPADSSSSSDPGNGESSGKSVPNNESSAGSGPEPEQGSMVAPEQEPSLTQKEIKQLYRPAFESLQAQATDKLNNLLSLAFNEFQNKKDNEEKISYSYFYQKYKTAADGLEANTNKAFQQIYQALEADLKANGYSASAASEFQEEYEAAKESRKNAILEKAKGLL